MKSTRGHCWKISGCKTNCPGTSVFFPSFLHAHTHTRVHTLSCQHTGFDSTFQRSAWHWLHIPTEFVLSGWAIRAPGLHKFWSFPWFGLTETAQLLFFFFKPKIQENLEVSRTSLIHVASVQTHKLGRLSWESSNPRAMWRLRFLHLPDTRGDM